MIRVIATLLWNGQTLVKGVGFDAWRSVGHPLQAINVFQMREVDEIIFLDITATREARRPDFKLIESLSRECFVPLTVGGGVKSVEDVRDLLRAGADKVSVRSYGYSVIPEASRQFGTQALVGCVEDGRRPYEGYCTLCTSAESHDFYDQGIGEILLQDVPQDGTLLGYHVELLDSLRCTIALDKTCPPIILSGGAGTYEHFYQAIQAGVSAVAAGAMWLFTEQTPLEAKRYLAARGVPVRL